MKVEELLYFLKENNISEDLFEIVDEPSYSKKILKKLELKYGITTAEVFEKRFQELNITQSDYTEWHVAFDNYQFFSWNKM